MSIYKEEKLCIYDENEIDQSNARIQKSKPLARSSSKLRLEHSKREKIETEIKYDSLIKKYMYVKNI
mgnify:CR=1 FL=1